MLRGSACAPGTLWGSVAGRDWLIPPGYGLWVPGGIPRSGSVLHSGEMVTIAFAPDVAPTGWTEPTCFAVGSSLGEIIAHLHGLDPHDPTRPTVEALMLALLKRLPAQSINVTMPGDPRARHVVEQLIAHPGDPRDLVAWAVVVHSSVRTLFRLFRAETGLAFTTWRTRVRIRSAIPLLADGRAVGTVARAVGYRKPSAFIAAFRRVTGQTPGTDLSQRASSSPTP